MKTVAAILLACLANGQGPATPATPAQPAPGGAPPAAGAPQAAAPVVLPPLIPLDTGSLSCSGRMCAGRTIEIRPSQDWSFDCPGDCRDMTINIRAGMDPANPGHRVTRLGNIKCNGPMSCQGSVINIYNENGMMSEAVQLGGVNCEVAGACQCMAIHSFGNVDIWTADFSCSMPGSCMGCVVKDNMKLEACDANNNPTGQLMMPWQVACTGRKPIADIQAEYMAAQQTHFQQAQILAQQQGMQNTNFPQVPQYMPPQPQQPQYTPPQPQQPQFPAPAQPQGPTFNQIPAQPQQPQQPQYQPPQYPQYPQYQPQYPPQQNYYYPQWNPYGYHP